MNLKFWKNKSPLDDLDEEKESSFENPSFEDNDSFNQGIPSFGTGMDQPQGKPTNELELVNSKLDAIKSELDSVNQRLKNIERIALQEQEQAKKQKLW